MKKCFGILAAIALTVGLGACDTAGRQASPAGTPESTAVTVARTVPHPTMCRPPYRCWY
jgi:hypothetical protein